VDGQRAPRRVGDELIRQARETNPLGFLSRHFSDVEINKREDAIVIEGVLRADKVAEGHWVACDWHGGAIGDNIALAQYVTTGISFPEAVFQLTGRDGERVITVAPKKEDEAPKYPRVPYQQKQDVKAGRDYLEERGISLATIEAAERAGFVRYCQNGVIFVGWDQEKKIRAATVRHIVPVRFGDGETLTKRDLSGTSKLHPGILPGDPAHVVIVEGGTNAMAVQDMARRRGQPVPTVVATGGAGVRKWVHDNPTARALVVGAESVTIWGERERDLQGIPDPVKQQRTDELREKLATVIAQVRDGEVPEILMPPESHKDVAEWLLDELKKQHEQRLRDEYTHDQGMDYR